MRSRWLALIILMLIVFNQTGYANNSIEIQQTFKKEQILRSINLLRSLQKQPPLSYKNFIAVPQAVDTKVTADDGGAIAGTLFGIVEDDIRTAVVVAWTADSTTGSTGTGFAVVEPSGAYLIDNLAAGDYYVLAVAEGYIPKFYDNVLNFNEATLVMVTKDAVTEDIDFYMEKMLPGSAGVSGVVLSESDEVPIAHAFVSVFSPDNPFLYGWAETSEDGSYKITGLKSGEYYASCWADGFLTEFFDNAETIEDATLIEVDEPNETSDINFTLTLGGIISGVVINDDGVPIAGAFVQAMTEMQGSDPTSPDSFYFDYWGFALTDEKGEYHIGGLQTGSYFVLAQAWNQWSHISEWYDNAPSPDQATPVLVEAGEETTGIDFQLSLPIVFGEIFGKVTDLEGQPIAGAFVQAQAPFNDPFGRVEVWAYAFTDKQGNYRIENLPNGRYLVSASAQSGWQFVQRWWPDAESPDEAEPVEVDGNTDLQPIDFKLPITTGTAIIAGKVVSINGTPLEYAAIQVSSVDPSTDPARRDVLAYANSDSNGYFQIDTLPAGTYFAHAQYWQNLSFGQQWYDHAESLADATPIHLVDGDIRDDINFELTIRPYYGAVAGSVTDEIKGVPIPRAYVEISPVGYKYYDKAPITFWSYYAITNENGNYQLEWLPEGKYIVSVYANGAFEYFENAVVPEQATPVEVIGGATTAVNFGLTPRNEGTGIISGKVTGEWNKELLEIAVVIARPAIMPLVWPDSEMFFNAVTNPDGTYQISGLPTGEYYVMSFAPGYIGEYYDNVFDPSEATLVKVDGIYPTTGIDFSLMPMLILERELATGPQNGAILFGKVADNNDNALRGATIYLLNDAEQPISFARSNAEGIYELRNVPPGMYRLKASLVGYHSRYNNSANSFSEADPIKVGIGNVEVNFILDSETVTGVKNRSNSTLPKSIELYGNYPNPFNPETRISFGLPSEMRVQLRIFNLLGQEIAQLFDGVLGGGVHHLTWDGRNQFGQSMPSGVYFYQLQANGIRVAVNKMTLLK
ncbi:MAG: carboxypeptidase regulatory-like domain-containing protein [bacterium]